MTGASAPYRKSGQRTLLTDAERRWFTKGGGVEKGPYALDVLTRAINSGVLKRTSLVRAEDDTEWRPANEVAAIMASVNPKVAGCTHDADTLSRSGGPAGQRCRVGDVEVDVEDALDGVAALLEALDVD